MSHLSRALLAVLGGLLTLSAANLVQAKSQEAFSADFAASLKLGAESEFSLEYAGKLYWDEPKVRIEFTDALTLEQVILIGDFDKGTGVALFPDTLNGYSAKLADVDSTGMLQMVPAYLAGEAPALPAGWSKVTPASETVRGKACTKYKVQSQDNRQFAWWKSSGGQLMRMRYAGKGKTITIEFTNHQASTALDSKLFTYSDKYQVTPVDADEREEVLPL